MSLLGGTVEASRAQRIERQQARYRDRGGIFKPAEHNPLLDLLLARGVNGESPSRTTSLYRSPSRSTSPRRKHSISHPLHNDLLYSHNATNTSSKTRRNSKRKPPDPNARADAHNALDDMSAPAPSTVMDLAPSRTSRTPKPTKKSIRSKSSARTAPPPDSSDNELPLLVRPNKSRAREAPPKSTKDKLPKPQQPRKRKVSSQSSAPTCHIDVLTDHEPPPTRRKKAKAKTTPSKSKVAVVVKLIADADPTLALTKSRAKQSAQLAQPIESESEQAPGKSAKGKLKAKSPEQEDHASQVSSNRATLKKTMKTTKICLKAEKQSDASQGLTNVPSAQLSTSQEMKKRKKPGATSSCDLPSIGRHVHLDSDSEKQPPQNRSPSPAPPAHEPARKRRKARAVDGEDDKPVGERGPLTQNRWPSRQTGNTEDANEARKISRSKAPPIPMPNGVRLKPKPRPRLSMFQPPPDDDGSDRDPIDFLS